MKLSTRGRYGVRAMLDLACHYGQGPILIKDIAQRQDISEKYLEQVMNSLRNSGLVKSMRGAKGGYVLAKIPGQIKVSDILHILEGSFAPVECVNDPKYCKRIKQCVTRDLWCEINNKIEEYFSSITLDNLIERYTKKLNQNPEYQI